MMKILRNAVCLGSVAWGLAISGVPVFAAEESASMKPLAPTSPAAVIQVKWKIEAGKEALGKVKASPFSLAGINPAEHPRWWLNGEEELNNVSGYSKRILESLASSDMKATSLGGEAVMFFPNLSSKPSKIHLVGFTVETQWGPLEVKAKLHPRDCPIQTVGENAITHFGVYEILVEISKPVSLTLKKGDTWSNPVLEGRGPEQMLRGAKGKMGWNVKASVKLIRAAEPEDERKALGLLKAEAGNPSSVLKDWASRIELALNPPPPPPPPEPVQKEKK